jgi:hypothetical protein
MAKLLKKEKKRIKSLLNIFKLQITDSHAASGSELVCRNISAPSVTVKISCAGSNSHTEFETENRKLFDFCCVTYLLSRFCK